MVWYCTAAPDILGEFFDFGSIKNSDMENYPQISVPRRRGVWSERERYSWKIHKGKRQWRIRSHDVCPPDIYWIGPRELNGGSGWFSWAHKVCYQWWKRFDTRSNTKQFGGLTGNYCTVPSWACQVETWGARFIGSSDLIEISFPYVGPTMTSCHLGWNARVSISKYVAKTPLSYAT